GRDSRRSRWTATAGTGGDRKLSAGAEPGCRVPALFRFGEARPTAIAALPMPDPRRPRPPTVVCSTVMPVLSRTACELHPLVSARGVTSPCGVILNSFQPLHDPTAGTADHPAKVMERCRNPPTLSQRVRHGGWS